MASVPAPVRYRCASCGNLTRFDVVERRRTRAFHHYSVSGELQVEEPQVLDAVIESVTCRWCGPSGQVRTVADTAVDAAAQDAARDTAELQP